MELSWFTLVNAVAVGIVISCMALFRNPRLKALIYTFPIPISIGLVATHGAMSSDNVIGLFLVCGFIWLTHALYKHGTPIVLAGVFAVLLYVGVGYVAVHNLRLNFWSAAVGYCVAWTILMLYLQKHHIKDTPGHRSGLPAPIKGGIATILSYILFSLKDLLSGIVVTFPFSGVFAVVETKHHLAILSRVMSRNSVALLGMFAAIYLVPDSVATWAKIGIGWAAFGVMMRAVRKITV